MAGVVIFVCWSPVITVSHAALCQRLLSVTQVEMVIGQSGYGGYQRLSVIQATVAVRCYH